MIFFTKFFKLLVRTVKQVISGLMACFLLISGAAAGDLKPTMGDDGIYHYDWYHQSFFELIQLYKHSSFQ